MEQKLEQILSFAPAQSKKYATIDIYAQATTALFTPPPISNFGYGMHSAPTHQTFDVNRCVQRTLGDYGFNSRPLYEPPKIEIEPYHRGMELDDGLKLYGNKSTAILHDTYTGIDIKHHDKGWGTLNYGDNRLLHLGERQSKLNDYL
jgi:hypothetical protein